MKELFIPLFKRTPSSENLSEIKKYIESQLNLISIIEQENDPKVVDICLNALQQTSNILNGINDISIRDDIKRGHGDFKRIQAKCIEMGLV